MKLLALMGSPRAGKNTDTLCLATLAGAEKEGCETERIQVSDLHFSPCTGCEVCYTVGNCVIADDVSHLYVKYDKADIIVLASPIYFHSVTAQLKAVIDRSQALWASKYVAPTAPLIDTTKRRLGLFLATGGGPATESAFPSAKDVVHTFFRAVNTHYWGELLVTGTDKNPVWENRVLLEKATQLGSKVALAFKQL